MIPPHPHFLSPGPSAPILSPTSQAWERLEKAEHERELALRTELIRQEKLEQLAARFDRKAAMRETWLSENQRLVSQVEQGGLLACAVWAGEVGEREWWVRRPVMWGAKETRNPSHREEDRESPEPGARGLNRRKGDRMGQDREETVTL